MLRRDRQLVFLVLLLIGLALVAWFNFGRTSPAGSNQQSLSATSPTPPGPVPESSQAVAPTSAGTQPLPGVRSGKPMPPAPGEPGPLADAQPAAQPEPSSEPAPVPDAATAQDEADFRVTAAGVVETPDRQPVPGALVHYSWVARRADSPEPPDPAGRGVKRKAGAKPAVRADAEGRFLLQVGLQTDTEAAFVDLYLSVSMEDGTSSARRVFTFRRGEQRDNIRLEMPATGGLRGRVVDALRNPVAGVEVTALNAGERGNMESSGVHGGGEGKAHKTEADGYFEIRGLLPEHYTLVLIAPGYRYLEVKDLVVEAGPPLDAGTIELVSATSLVASLSADFVELAGLAVFATFVDADDKYLDKCEGRADASGRVVFSPAPLEARAVWIHGEHFAPVRCSCVIVAGKHNDIGSVSVSPPEKPKG